MKEKFFAETYQEKTGGESYEINVMMIKIQLEPGTSGSR
jgi:hypothetical protein